MLITNKILAAWAHNTCCTKESSWAPSYPQSDPMPAGPRPNEYLKKAYTSLNINVRAGIVSMNTWDCCLLIRRVKCYGAKSLVAIQVIQIYLRTLRSHGRDLIMSYDGDHDFIQASIIKLLSSQYLFSLTDDLHLYRFVILLKLCQP